MASVTITINPSEPEDVEALAEAFENLGLTTELNFEDDVIHSLEVVVGAWVIEWVVEPSTEDEWRQARYWAEVSAREAEEFWRE